jgi:hypothetical protein
MDNYGTHKVSEVQACLVRHPRYRVHFTPTSGSWLHMVERLFAEVTERCVRRGSHTNVRSLERAMLDYLGRRNNEPKPFVWTADAAVNGIGRHVFLHFGGPALVRTSRPLGVTANQTGGERAADLDLEQ